MDYIKRLNELSPLIHCITNTVTVNECANAVLAVGARPIMAEHPAEAAEITGLANALLINTGSLTDSKIAAMKASAAAVKGKPFVLDCVGAASSSLRREVINQTLEINTPSVIKGNASEILALCTGKISKSGVDATEGIDEALIHELAVNTGAVIAVSGKEDIITDGQRTAHIKNGCAMMSRVTGTGCMLGCVTAALMSVADAYSAAVYAAAVMGICGEAADTNSGAGSFAVRLMDELSLITDADVSKKIRMY